MTDTALNGFDIHRIMDFLPHRYPFLMIDRVLECDSGKSLTALKNVSFNEPFFQGHFPGQPIMPGVLILEALAQATGLLAFCSMGDQRRDKLYLLVGIDKARFRGQVTPGDQLRLSVELKRDIRGIGFYSCVATVGEQVVTEAEMMCSAQERQP